MKNLFCVIFILISNDANAQFSDLIKYKSIAWVGESSMDIRLDMLHDEQIKSVSDETDYKLNNVLNIIKFNYNKNAQEREEGYSFFANILLEAAKNKQIKVYSDSVCLRPIDILDVIVHSDTLNIDLPQPNNEPIIMKTFIQSDEIKVFRMHQITTYSPKTGNWNNKTISVAPLKMVRDKNGKFISWKPIFWIKVDNKKTNLNASNITWAVQTKTKGIESDLQLNKVKIYKKDLEKPMIHFLNLAKNNEAIKLYSSFEWEKDRLFSLKERQSLFTKIDTIIVINPITNLEELKISESTLDFTIINSLRLTQEWVWDNKRKSLSVRTLGASFLSPNKDEAGNVRFFEGLYQRFNN
jgi:hypothetical protein